MGSSDGRPDLLGNVVPGAALVSFPSPIRRARSISWIALPQRSTLPTFRVSVVIRLWLQRELMRIESSVREGDRNSARYPSDMVGEIGLIFLNYSIGTHKTYLFAKNQLLRICS